MAKEQMGLIGTKMGMTQIYSEDGDVLPCTIIQAGPCTITQVKSEDGPDGYNAIQIGFGTQKEQRLTKPFKGHVAKAGVLPRYIREIRVNAETAKGFEVGKAIGPVDVFEVGQFVDVSATSKGRGFAGVMKKYNFAGFIRSHGSHEFFRHGGSIGCRLTPGRVVKGKKMPGQMGNKKVTVQNLKIVRIDAERNLIFVLGGVPGANGGLVTTTKAVKK